MKIIIKYLLLFFGSCWVINSSAQEKAKKEDTYLHRFGISVDSIPTYRYNSVDNEKELKERELERQRGTSYSAKGIKVDIGIEQQNFPMTQDGMKVFIAKVKSVGALEIRLFFKNFDLADGEDLLIYDKTFKKVSSYNSTNYKNQDSIIITEPFDGDEVIIELKYKSDSPKLKIHQVIHGFAYNDNDSNLKNARIEDENANSCHEDFTCYADEFLEVGASVVKIFFTYDDARFGEASGVLINNTSNDGTPYLLTAAHSFYKRGEISAILPLAIFTFNYENSKSKCCIGREVNETSVTGADALFLDDEKDLVLLKLRSKPTKGMLYFAGWDANPSDRNYNFPFYSIHHPQGDYKKISIDLHGFNETKNNYIIAFHQPPTSTFPFTIKSWEVEWEKGFQEPGSSGSPLFDKYNKIIGISSRRHDAADPCNPTRSSPNKSGFAVISNGGADLLKYLAPNSATKMMTPIVYVDGVRRDAVINKREEGAASICSNLKVEFDASTQNIDATGGFVSFNNRTEGGTGNLTYEWDFGDGQDAFEKNDRSPSHYYSGNTDGIAYSVWLKVTDGNGNTGISFKPSFIKVPTPSTCSNRVKDPLEIGVDCGGHCAPCPVVLGRCNDGKKNGQETDIDCGGPDCRPCPDFCNDGTQQDTEKGVDCGSSHPLYPCRKCEELCDDGKMNGDEYGIDCGPSCRPCVSLINGGTFEDISCKDPINYGYIHPFNDPPCINEQAWQQAYGFSSIEDGKTRAINDKSPPTRNKTNYVLMMGGTNESTTGRHSLEAGIFYQFPKKLDPYKKYKLVFDCNLESEGVTPLILQFFATKELMRVPRPPAVPSGEDKEWLDANLSYFEKPNNISEWQLLDPIHGNALSRDNPLRVNTFGTYTFDFTVPNDQYDQLLIAVKNTMFKINSWTRLRLDNIFLYAENGPGPKCARSTYYSERNSFPDVTEASNITTGINVSIPFSNGMPVIFKASSEVKLEDGFVSEPGAEFVATIERCGISMSSREEYSEAVFSEVPISGDVSESKEQLDLMVHPNPSTGEINAIVLSKGDHTGELSIFDIYGNKVYEIGEGVLATKYELNLGFLQNGLYIVRLKGEKQDINRKFILAK